MARFNYYRDRPKKSYGQVLGLVLIVALLYFLGGTLISPLAGPIRFMMQPAWWASDGLGMIELSVIDFFHNENRLAESNRRLTAENTKFKSIILAKNQVEVDNAYLRQILGRINKEAKPLVGQIIFLPNFVPYQTLLIDLGKANLGRPMMVGDLAVVYGAVVIGRVAEVGEWYSKVRLLSAENNLAVMIGSKNIPAVASGAGAGNFSITLPKDTLVVIGDRVVAPLLNNLLIGTVRYVEKKPSQPNQTILVKTPVNLWQLKWLEIYNAKT